MMRRTNASGTRSTSFDPSHDSDGHHCPEAEHCADADPDRVVILGRQVRGRDLGNVAPTLRRR